MNSRHVLLVTYPAQGHINPALRFAQRLIHIGIDVTFVTTVHARRRMVKASAGDAPKGLNFETFSDGYDDGFKPSDDFNRYMSELRNSGSRNLKDIIVATSERGRPVTCLVYAILIPWAAEVAREVHVPCALLWIQPATVLDVYYYYFRGFEDEIKENSDDPSWKIQFPGIPYDFSKGDLPSFILPSSSERYSFALPSFKEQIDALDLETKPKVLVNTFDALEPDALKSIENYEFIGIGPLIPPAFLSDGQVSSDKSFGVDLFQKSDDYIEWLNSKPDSSVVYVSFGSLLNLPKSQMEEIARGLLDSKRPFLWVIRAKQDDNIEEDEKLSCMEELGSLGKIVPWCSQLEVLTHKSLGCFVTHCGWNSTLESLSCGVPMVAFPQWTDQGTNAKLIEDVWKVGVRVKVNENGVVESDEIRSCIEQVMDGGERGRELRENGRRWKVLARKSMEEDGSSNNNLKAFLQEIRIK
ncbi:crocetin glucosyltransferase, chloroplastic-like [Primulina huaijiensis]|uniref:crocetin glucosyltransferase, chloroplastic-like n=1 Tax=Primulina huaijiensis TaxID=1492673 RepID=UPI003CC74D7B